MGVVSACLLDIDIHRFYVPVDFQCTRFIIILAIKMLCRACYLAKGEIEMRNVETSTVILHSIYILIPCKQIYWILA